MGEANWVVVEGQEKLIGENMVVRQFGTQRAAKF